MRNESHTTFIGILRAGVSEWRKREGLSRESVCQVIVETHDRTSGPDATGIRFEPKTTDTFARQHANAERIFRWLDDESKDNNLLPTNFVRSILAAMPADIRMHCVDEFLEPVGLAGRSIFHAEPAVIDVQKDLRAMIKEGSEANQAFTELMGSKDPAVLHRAHKEISDSIEEQTRIRGELEVEMARAKVTAIRK